MSLFENFIDGAWVPGSSQVENYSPSDTSDVIGLFTHGDAADISDAVDAATMASASWALTGLLERSDILMRAGDLIQSNVIRLSELLAREEGKTLKEATGEVTRAARVFRFFAQELIRPSGQFTNSIRPDVEVYVEREPVGVVGLITPWNFPILIPAWKAASALAFGNTVVMKPSEVTPACAWELASILDEAGLPPGVFNLVQGTGVEAGEALARHPNVDAISFTGSVSTGRRVAALGSETLKKIQLEMGGKNPMLILNDADLEKTIPVCMDGAFAGTGQRCTASSRLIVTEGIHDEFVERLLAAIDKVYVGHALEPGSTMGPVASLKQLTSNLKYVELARKEGAEVIGGERLTRDTDGYFQAPAVFLNAKNDSRTSQEEIFGPCASIIKVTDFEEAVAVANDTEFGLSSGICTTSLNAASAFRAQSRAGMVMVNLPTGGVDFHVPFGGRKQSSFGPREQGTAAADFYSTTKTSYVRA